MCIRDSACRINVSIWFVSWISRNKVVNIRVLEINTACVCLLHILLKSMLCTDVLDVVYDGRVYIKWKQFITTWHKLMLVFIYYCVRYDVDCLNILTLYKSTPETAEQSPCLLITLIQFTVKSIRLLHKCIIQYVLVTVSFNNNELIAKLITVQLLTNNHIIGQCTVTAFSFRLVNTVSE